MKTLPKLECMSTSLDGSHRGLTDWYPEIEKGIQEALNRGPEDHWTTGWYASKHELASACITNDEDGLKVEVTVTDDFDTIGNSEQTVPHTTDIDTLRARISQAWEEADKVLEENKPYIGFKIADENGAWVETYIKPNGCDLDEPPGDNYHNWGWQDSCDLSDEIKAVLQEFADTYEPVDGVDQSATFQHYTIEPWS